MLKTYTDKKARSGEGTTDSGGFENLIHAQERCVCPIHNEVHLTEAGHAGHTAGGSLRMPGQDRAHRAGTKIYSENTAARGRAVWHGR